MLQSVNHFRILLDLLLLAYVCLMLGSPELDMLLTDIQLVFQDLWVLYCRASSQSVDPPGLMDEVFLPQMQDLVLPFEFRVVPVGLSCNVALNGNMPTYYIYSSSWFLHHLQTWRDELSRCVISEAIKQAWPPNQHLSIPLLTCLELRLCPVVVKWVIWCKKQGLIFPTSMRNQLLSMRSKHEWTDLTTSYYTIVQTKILLKLESIVMIASSVSIMKM